jgi:hypothetical protein
MGLERRRRSSVPPPALLAVALQGEASAARNGSARARCAQGSGASSARLGQRRPGALTRCPWLDAPQARRSGDDEGGPEAGPGKALGLYGFGAAAHIVAQVARWQGRSVHAFTRPGDTAAQAFARSLGAAWAGGSDEAPPEPLDAAIIFATVGELVPLALRAVRKGGRVVCAGIHMSDIPGFPYGLLWEERQIVSVANLTRQDGLDFLRLAPGMGIVTKVARYPLMQANQALADLRAGRFEGAAVLVP